MDRKKGIKDQKKLLKHFSVSDLEWMGNTTLWAKLAHVYLSRQHDKTLTIIEHAAQLNVEKEQQKASLALLAFLPLLFVVIPDYWVMYTFDHPLSTALMLGFNVGLLTIAWLYYLGWQPTPLSFSLFFFISAGAAFTLAVEGSLYLYFFEAKLMMLLPLSLIIAPVLFMFKGALMGAKPKLYRGVIAELKKDLQFALDASRDARREELLELISLEAEQERNYQR